MLSNSFAVFDIAPSFDVDGDALEAAYKSLQRRVHPDSFYSKSRVEVELALQVACGVWRVACGMWRVTSYILCEFPV
jgi:DnaJ-domain-containing protein 1